jgi:hypothetical protein
MRRTLRDFSEQVRDADMALVFYAGHGMELNGVNYMIPVDATLARDVDVEDEAVPLDRVIRTIEPAHRLQLVILDACRDNPFVRSMRRTFVSRSLRSGHGDIDERALPPNTLIAYAQKAGLTAEDGDGADSPYTTALLKHLTTPGLDIELALRRVREDVLKATKNRQEPFKYGSLGGAEVPLVPGALKQAPTVTKAKPLTYLEYVEAFETGQPVIRGAPFTTEDMGSLAALVFERGTKPLAGTRWQGGANWGDIAFDASGRVARYALGLGGTPGRLLLQGVLGDSGHRAGPSRGVVVADPILLGEWQEGENKGGVILKLGHGEIRVLWGPRFLREETWTRAQEQEQAAVTASDSGATLNHTKVRKPIGFCQRPSVSM